MVSKHKNLELYPEAVVFHELPAGSGRSELLRREVNGGLRSRTPLFAGELLVAKRGHRAIAGPVLRHSAEPAREGSPENYLQARELPETTKKKRDT